MSPRYILDTDICIHARRRRSSALQMRFDDLKRGDAVLSVITYGELLYGARKSKEWKKALDIIEKFASFFEIVHLTEETAQAYSILRADLASRGEIIGSNDLWIAAHARQLGLTLVTGNEREFRRIAALKIENWTR